MESKEAKERLDEALFEAASGGAVCFLGAGFSAFGKSSQGSWILSSRQLSDRIRDIAGLSDDEEGSLSELADFCESTPDMKMKLHDLLVSEFTVTEPSEIQRRILKLPWRAIFTTNFDDLAERALETSRVSVISPTSSNDSVVAGKTPIYYLHGRAADLIERDAPPSIVVSESNYLNLSERNRELYAELENSIYYSNKIFFIGYSLSDISIATKLFAIESLRKRSVVITRPNAGVVANSRLSKFGDVHSIGIEKFSSRIEELASNPLPTRHSQKLTHVRPFEVAPSSVGASFDDIQKLFISGIFEESLYLRQVLDGPSADQYCISRQKALERIFELHGKGINRYFATASIGNGKTVFAMQFAVEARQKGFEVYFIKSNIPEVYSDLEDLLSQPGRRVFILDDMIRYRRVAHYIGQRLGNSSIILTTGREEADAELHREISEVLNGNTRIVDLDSYNPNEISKWNTLLERWGLWEERIALDEASRSNFLSRDCNSENRSIIVSIFNSSKIGSKIEAIVNFFLSRNPNLRIAFLGALINSLCQKHVDWDRIVAWLDIDEGNLREKVLASDVFHFMANSRHWHEFASTTLADFIFSRFLFDTSEIVETYTIIVRNTAYNSTDRTAGYDALQNLKELLRFRYLTRLLGNREDATSAILAVYKRLSVVPKIRENDQFWLQYAMAMIEQNELDTAEGFINTAIGLASKKGYDYSKKQIYDQRARLRLRKYSDAGRIINKTEIIESLKDLIASLSGSSETVVHALRSSPLIVDFIEQRFDDLEPKLVEELRSTLEAMKQALPQGRLKKSQKGETEFLKKKVREGLIILANI